MSESQSAVRAGVGAGGLSRPIDSEACVPGVPHAPPAASAAVWQAVREAMSFPVLMAGLLVGVSLVSLTLRLPDPDTCWHVAVGEHIWTTHTWPTSDFYSFTAPGVHWMAYEWLGEGVMALAARARGHLGLAVAPRCLVDG